MKALLALWCGGLSGLAAVGCAASLSDPITYQGMCDASAAVSLTTNLFIVANDEDNILRVYRRHPGGLPILSVDFNAFLRVAGKSTETDLEGAARIGDRIYWISSHGRNAKGRSSPNRHRFFATTVAVTNDQVEVKPLGRPYTSLLRDLTRDPRLAEFHLAFAARLAPKLPGGLNIEGLSATPDGHLLLGFRNPIPRGLALVVPLLNPADLIEGNPAKFGKPILLDLGGLGVRSMGLGDDKYLIIAGPYVTDGESRLYDWDGRSPTPKMLSGIRLPGFNPEGLAFYHEGGRSEFFLVSDDGTLKIGGVDCKRLKDPTRRQFHGYSLSP